jgi:hypothetical protein
MKYEIKEQHDDIFIIKVKPNNILLFFGIHKCFDIKYKVIGNYQNYQRKAIMREDGEILSPFDPITTLINNHLRKF